MSKLSTWLHGKLRKNGASPADAAGGKASGTRGCHTAAPARPSGTAPGRTAGTSGVSGISCKESSGTDSGTIFGVFRNLLSGAARNGPAADGLNMPVPDAARTTPPGIPGKAAPNTSGKTGKKIPDASRQRGFLVFQHTGEVILAERILREAGFAVEVKGPPPELRTGCDMVVVFGLMREPQIRAALEAARLEPVRVVPMGDGLLEPVSLFQVSDYGNWFMVRAANMKITVERASGKIVNISGGGCPDVPYLAALLTGQCIGDAEEPRVNGRTLCSYSLQRAFEEAGRIWREGRG